MKNDRLLAARYAEALSQAVPNVLDLAAAWDDLRTLSGVFSKSEELRRVIKSPAIDGAAKARAIRAIGERLGMRAPALHFVATLAQHGNLAMLPHIAQAVGLVVDRKSGIAEVAITTATAIDDTTRSRLVAALEKAAGCKVRVSETVDSSLIGGLIARIGATVYDGSLRTKLEKMRSRLAG